MSVSYNCWKYRIRTQYLEMMSLALCPVNHKVLDRVLNLDPLNMFLFFNIAIGSLLQNITVRKERFKHISPLQVDWVTMNFVPFAERCVELVTEMYSATASHNTVIQARVLQNIIKVSRVWFVCLLCFCLVCLFV